MTTSSTTIARIDYPTRDILRALSVIRKKKMISLIREYAEADAERIIRINPQLWEQIYEGERLPVEEIPASDAG